MKEKTLLFSFSFDLSSHNTAHEYEYKFLENIGNCKIGGNFI